MISTVTGHFDIWICFVKASNSLFWEEMRSQLFLQWNCLTHLCWLIWIIWIIWQQFLLSVSYHELFAFVAQQSPTQATDQCVGVTAQVSRVASQAQLDPGFREDNISWHYENWRFLISLSDLEHHLRIIEILTLLRMKSVEHNHTHQDIRWCCCPLRSLVNIVSILLISIYLVLITVSSVFWLLHDEEDDQTSGTVIEVSVDDKLWFLSVLQPLILIFAGEQFWWILRGYQQQQWCSRGGSSQHHCDHPAQCHHHLHHRSHHHHHSPGRSESQSIISLPPLAGLAHAGDTGMCCIRWRSFHK